MNSLFGIPVYENKNLVLGCALVDDGHVIMHPLDVIAMKYSAEPLARLDASIAWCLGEANAKFDALIASYAPPAPVRTFICGAEGCDALATVALRFRDQIGHVHVCPADEALDREWCDVIESHPMPCPWLCSEEPIGSAIPTILNTSQRRTHS